MAIFKTFDAYLIDAQGDVVSSIGKYNMPILHIPGISATVSLSYNTPSALANAVSSVLGTEYSFFGNWVNNPGQDEMEFLLAGAPITQVVNLARSDATLKLKLVSPSGYYAIGRYTQSGSVFIPTQWTLYTNEDVALVSGASGAVYGFPGYEDDVSCVIVTDMQQGIILNYSDYFYYAYVWPSSSQATFRVQSRSGANYFFRWLNGCETWVPPTPSDDPYDNLPTPGDGAIPGGGSVGIPPLPPLSATSAGVIGLFAPSAAQMQLLADFMWTDFGGTGTTVEDILKEVVEALKRSISNPLDYVVGLNIIPSQGLSVGASKVVRFGFISSGVSMPQLASQYFTVDCGSIAFDTVCGDTFLDYAPYSKFSIYLPYIGFKDVDPNDFVGHTIGVVYHGDCVTGGVTAFITKDGTVMYQYSGCCALNVPLSADNWGETISAAINVATGIVAAAASGGAAGLAQGALQGAASVAANPSLLSPQVNHSGAVSGGAGCMGVQFPFVIREAVNFHSTAGFNKSTGYPAYYYKKLGDVTGFTTVIDAHLSNIPMATQDEIAEIESLLESGVIL